jgi:hypothetical protein
MKINPDSETWKELSSRLDKEMQNTTKKVLQSGTDLAITEYWRGYYAALKNIRALPQQQELKAVPMIDYN